MDRQLCRKIKASLKAERIAGAAVLDELASMSRSYLQSARPTDNAKTAVIYALYRFFDRAADDHTDRTMEVKEAVAFSKAIGPSLHKVCDLISGAASSQSALEIISDLASADIALLPH